MIGKSAFILCFFFFSVLAFANEGAIDTAKSAENANIENTHSTPEHGSEAKFEPGKFILHHVVDAHEWHILQYKDFYLTIPLPIILWSEKSGIVAFLSSNFKDASGNSHNLHADKFYGGYKISPQGHISAIDESKVYDFSITKNVVGMFVSIIILCFIFITASNRYIKKPNSAPKGIQSLVEPLIVFLRDDVIRPSLGEKRTNKYAPFLLTLFFFIFLNNLMGLIPIFPGGANVTGNIAITMVLALFTFVITTFSGNKSYWTHIFNAPGVPWWLKLPIPLMPIVELVGVFTKPFVLMVRLFANITAGHIIALGFFSLIFIFGAIAPAIGYGVSIVSIAFTVFMTVLELLVAFIQAYVFTLLSAIYFGMATEEHHHVEEHH